MKTYSNSLNKIFKSPLFKALFIVCMFFSFLFVRTVNSEKVEAVDIKIDNSKSDVTKTISWNGVDGENGLDIPVSVSSAVNRTYVEYGSTNCMIGYKTKTPTIYFRVKAASSTGVTCRTSTDSTTVASYMYIWVYFRRGSVESESYEFRVDSTNALDNDIKITLNINGASAISQFHDGPQAYWTTTLGNSYYATSLTDAYVSSSSKTMDFAVIVKNRVYTGAPSVYLYNSTSYYSTSLGQFTCTALSTLSGYASTHYCELIGVSLTEGVHSWQVRAWHKNGAKARNDTSWNTGSFTVDLTYPEVSSTSLKGTSALAQLWTNSQSFSAVVSYKDNYLINSAAIHEGNSVIHSTTSTTGINSSVSLASNTEGEHTLTVVVCDQAENCVYAGFVMYYDKTAPVIDNLSTSSGTIGKDGNRYITGSSFSTSTEYSDDMGIGKLEKTSTCTYSGTTYGLTSDYPNFNPSGTCDISSTSVSYTSKRSVYIRVYDFAGNYVTQYLYFYKIDTTRKITISGFSIRGYGALVDNWMGPQSLTSGDMALFYTLSNSSYINKDYMLVRDEENLGLLWLWTDLVQSATGIVDTITSGKYFSLDDDYGGVKSVAQWYEKIEHGDSHEISFTLKNIYGQTTKVTTIITFDFTSPTTPSVSNTSSGSWTNQDVTLTPSGSTDTGSGVYTYKYGTSSSSTTTSTTGVKFTTERDSYYYFRAYDKAGNYSSYTSTRVRIDKTKPSNSLSVTNSSSGEWTNQNVVLEITGATDTGTYKSGAYKVQYSYDQSSWMEDWDSDSTISKVKGTWSAERNNTVYFRVLDLAGNISNVSSSTTKVRIDKTNPNGSLTISNTSSSNWTNQDVTLTISGATDTAHASVNSGISYYQFSYDGTNWAAKSELGDGTGHYNTSTGAKDTWSAERDNTVYFRACDLAGNCTKYSQTTKVRIDKTNPTMSNIGNSYNNTWTNQDVTVTVSGGADTSGNYNSGFSKYQYSTDNSSWSNTVTKTFTSEMNATVYYRPCDVAGNCGSSKSTTLKIDKTKPKFTLSNTSGGSWTNQNVTLTPSAGADTGTYQSGFSIYQYSTNNSSWSTVTAGKSYSAEQNSTYYFRACDVAGNCLSKSSAVKIDKTNPSQPGITNSSSGNWTNKDVTLTATGGADTGTYQSGFSHYQYSTNNSSWSTLSTTTYTTEQNKTYYYRACDNAGNCGSSKSSNVKIDKSEPVGTITVDKNAKTATIEITDAWSIADSQSKVGSNYKYFLSKELNLTKAQVQAIPDDAWLSPETTGANGTTIPMNVSSGKYYLYVKVSNAIKDSATNTVAIKGLDDQYSYYTTKGNYVIYRQLVDINSTNYGDDSSSFDEDDMNKEMNGSIASLGAQVIIMDRIIMVTFASEATLPDGFTMVTINNVLSTVGYELVTVDRSKTYDFEGSYPFEDVLIAKLDANNKASEVEVMDLIVIITAPQVGNSGASTNVIEQGEEIGNVAVSFISDVEFNVEKEIIHNGVKVNKIDTNNPGVYEVRYTAIDVMGRVNKVKRTLVVKEGVKEEVEVKVEEIKETPEIITPVVVNNAPVEVQSEANANRKVVENVQVEMRIENKEEVKGYKKRKEVKEEKKSDLTFKLFSKWFFKVYDG